MIRQYVYHLSLNLFYLKNQIIVYQVLLVTMFLLFSEFVNVVSILYYTFTEFIILLLLLLYSLYYTFFSNFFCSIHRKHDLKNSFSKYLDVSPSLTCARAIGNLWSILIPFPFCGLLKLNIFLIISITLSEFSISRISFLSTLFLKSIHILLMWFTIFLFVVSLELDKSFIKNDRLWYLKYSLNISVLMSLFHHLQFDSKNLHKS